MITQYFSLVVKVPFRPPYSVIKGILLSYLEVPKIRLQRADLDKKTFVTNNTTSRSTLLLQLVRMYLLSACGQPGWRRDGRQYVHNSCVWHAA